MYYRLFSTVLREEHGASSLFQFFNQREPTTRSQRTSVPHQAPPPATRKLIPQPKDFDVRFHFSIHRKAKGTFSFIILFLWGWYLFILPLFQSIVMYCGLQGPTWRRRKWWKLGIPRSRTDFAMQIKPTQEVHLRGSKEYCLLFLPNKIDNPYVGLGQNARPCHNNKFITW